MTAADPIAELLDALETLKSHYEGALYELADHKYLNANDVGKRLIEEDTAIKKARELIEKMEGEASPYLLLAQAFESINNAIVFGSRDWGAYGKDAWIYGIVVGWDEDDGSESEATRDICRRHKIKPEGLVRMRSMHRVVAAAREALPESMCPIKMARERLDADGKTTTD